MLKCGGGLKIAERTGMVPASPAERVVDHFPAALEVADPNTAARRRRPLDYAECYELVDQLSRARFVDFWSQRQPNLAVARACTGPLDPLDDVGQRFDPTRRCC